MTTIAYILLGILLSILIGFLVLICWITDISDKLVIEIRELKAVIRDKEENIKKLCEGRVSK